MINQTLSSNDVLMSSADNEGNLAKNKKMLVKEKLGGGNFQNRMILSLVKNVRFIKCMNTVFSFC